MENRPFNLKGKIHINEDYIIGRVIKNANVDDKKIYIQVIDIEHKECFEEGYLGYIFDGWTPKNIEGLNYGVEVFKVDTLIDNDVIELTNDFVHVLYRDDSKDNFILVTNQCNSNCIMCPDSNQVRNNRYIPDIARLKKQVRCIPDDTKSICITGGEPGILKYNLIELLRECKECLPETEFLLLSNGRVFSDKNFANEFAKNIPQFIRVAIPIYSSIDEIHNNITRAENSLQEALSGIKNLMKNNVDVEIRIVLLKANQQYLEELAEYISKNLTNVKIVNIMALEMSGNAYINKNDVWIDYNSVKKILYKSVMKMICSGINVNLYNFPLCQIDKRLFSLAQKSISDYKVRFKDECDECKLKQYCGGFFFSTINMDEIKIKPIK